MSSGRPYHHGDLRTALLSAALEEIDAVGASRLSLREVARRAGVSHAAPRHHFRDKAGLLTALAADGYRMLAQSTAEAAVTGSLEQVGLAYVRFALAHPAHFAVMFRPDLYDQQDEELVRQRDAAAAVLLDAVGRDLGAGAGEQELLAGVVAAWSATHGFATLWVTGNLAFTEEADPEQLALRAFRALRSAPRG